MKQKWNILNKNAPKVSHALPLLLLFMTAKRSCILLNIIITKNYYYYTHFSIGAKLNNPPFRRQIKNFMVRSCKIYRGGLALGLLPGWTPSGLLKGISHLSSDFHAISFILSIVFSKTRPPQPPKRPSLLNTCFWKTLDGLTAPQMLLSVGRGVRFWFVIRSSFVYMVMVGKFLGNDEDDDKCVVIGGYCFDLLCFVAKVSRCF